MTRLLATHGILAAAFAAWCGAALGAPGTTTPQGFDATVRASAGSDARRVLEAELRTQAFRLWELGGYGLDRTERAAWVLAEAGGLAWKPWPWDRRYLQSRWLGPTPRGAIAIVHTHPAIVDPHPSQTDRDTAMRLGIPVYTVSRTGIWRAEPDGGETRVGDEHWWAGCEARKACRESVSAPFALAAAKSSGRGETTERSLRITE